MVSYCPMTDWDSLAKSQNYEAMLEAEAEAVTPKQVFLVISSALALGKGKKALELLLANRTLLWEANPLLLLKVHFETRFLLGQFDEAYEDYAYFSSLPYVSQAVEEQLRDLPHRIRVEEVSSRGPKAFDEEEMHSILSTERDPAALLAYLNSLKRCDLTPFIGDLHSLLESNDVHDDAKSFVLMLLSAAHDEVTVSFEKGGKRFTLVPAEVRMPYGEPYYRSVREIIAASKDPSVGNIAGDLLDQYVLLLYPSIYKGESLPQEEADAFLTLASIYLHASTPNGEVPKRVQEISDFFEMAQKQAQ